MSQVQTDTQVRGQVFDIQRFSVHDGPGIRTTVFFKGCPLRCAWCQNPESVPSEPQLLLYADLCIGCGACLAVCPERAGEAEGAVSAQRPATCKVCGACAEACPAGARRIAGREMSVAEVVAQVLRDKPFYGDEGGATLSGGEPLAQWEFAGALADALHGEGVSVALDTACAAPEPVLEAVPEQFDLVLADLKFVSPAAHCEWTGADNAGVLSALRLWSRTMPGRIWVSVPLIPGVHDEAEIGRIAGFVRSLSPVPPVRLVPYHRLGDSKYAALGGTAPAFPGSVDALVEVARAAFRAQGVELLEQ